MPITESSEEKALKKDLTQEEIPVWVVDDDEVRYSIRFALATHGIDARTYASGEDFFNLVETDQPGCLVVDLTMPGMSGIEVLKLLRDLDSPIKVIVLSGHGTIRTAVEAMENGAISFMEKPVDPDDLLVKINAARDASLLEVRKTRVRHMLRQFSKRGGRIIPVNIIQCAHDDHILILIRIQAFRRLHRIQKVHEKQPHRRLVNPVSVYYSVSVRPVTSDVIRFSIRF